MRSTLGNTRLDTMNLNGTQNYMHTNTYNHIETEGNKAKGGGKYLDTQINERLNTKAANYNQAVQITENVRDQGVYQNMPNQQKNYTAGKEKKNENLDLSNDKKKKNNKCFIL